MNKLFTKNRISLSNKNLLLMIKHLLIGIFIFSQFTFAQNYGSLRFTNYADDRQSAFSFTFDDGLLTHSKNARPILNQYGFKGTFYVLPPYLADENQDTIWRYGTWPDFQLMAAEGHEIGSHTMNHDTLIYLPWGDKDTEGTLLYELNQSKIFIEQRILTEKCISFNYPYTIHNTVVDSAVSLFYENGRTDGEDPNDSSLSEKGWYNLKGKVVRFSLPRNSISDDYDELEEFLTSTVSSIDNHKWEMIIIHDVVPFSELNSIINQTYEPITNEWLTSLCDYLWARSLSKKIWIETVGNITRYIKERDDASYKIVSSSSELIEIEVTDDLDNEIYNYPLSAYIKIPDDWTYVKTDQNGVIDTLTTILTDTGRVVLAKVIPDDGYLNITPISPSFAESNVTSVADFNLFQNYPNPFNPSTKIKFSIPTSPLNPSPYQGEGNRERFVSLKVYDVLGNEVSTLVNEYKSAGSYEVNFDASSLSSGVYYYQIKVGSFFETKKMILIR